MLLYLSIGLVVLGYYLIKFYLTVRKYPPGPIPLPFIGNLLQIDFKNPHKTLDKWGQLYGPVYTVWMPLPNVVLNNFETIKETLVKSGDTFAGRPTTWIADFFCKGNYGIGFANGSVWKEHRRFALHVLRDLGFGKKTMERKILDQCHDVIVEDFAAKSGQCFDPQLAVQACVLNVVNELLFGYSYKVSDPEFLRMKKVNDELLEAFSDPRMLLLDLLPWLEHVPYIMGMEKLHSSYDAMVDYLKERVVEQKKIFNEDEESTNYTQAFLKEMAERKERGEINEADDTFTDWQLIMVLMDMWTAGMETTVTSLRWALLFMLNEPQIQAKIRADIEKTLGTREVSMEDKNKLPYIQAVLTEVQRCSNIVPINLQHTVTENVFVNGFVLPKDTLVLPQIASVHIDERVFPDPERFDPDRHLNADESFNKIDQVVPFSMGKRVCLGESLARMELFLIFTTLIQKFRFTLKGEKLSVSDASMNFIKAPLSYECFVEAVV